MEISLNLAVTDTDPRALVDAAVYAERMGFRTVWVNDHIFPWYHSSRRCSLAWSMMPVALAKTSRIKVGPWVTVPIGARYHPAIIAQAAATLDNMYPGRFVLGVGTGEALNERPFWNGHWPKWEERIGRLTEGIRLMRQLWESEEPFKFEGKYFSSDFYYLYTKPKRRIPIYSSAIGKRAAHAAGAYADGLITISPRNNPQKLKETILPAYTQGRRENKKEGTGKIAIELKFSFAEPEDFIKDGWRSLGSSRKDSWSIPDPVKVEEEAKKATMGDLRRNMHFCKSWRELVKLIEAYQEVGVNEVNNCTGCDRRKIKAFAKNVLEVF